MNEKKDFCVNWEKERKKGATRFYISRIKGIVAIILGLIIGWVALQNKVELCYLIIMCFVVLLFPGIVWIANERKYLKLKNQDRK